MNVHGTQRIGRRVRKSVGTIVLDFVQQSLRCTATNVYVVNLILLYSLLTTFKVVGHNIVRIAAARVSTQMHLRRTIPRSTASSVQTVKSVRTTDSFRR
jgi:hypothetical protein